MREKKVMHLNDTERPKASKRTFCQTWELKHPISSSQVPEFQSVSGVPSQTEWIGPKMYHSHLLTKVLLEAYGNVDYFLTVTASPCQRQLHTNSGSFQATNNCSNGLPHVARSSSPSETSAEEEILEICASDLLLESPARKRPRLLPPNRKIHMEVQRKKASHLPEERVRSNVPLEYNHLVDTMKLTTPADLREAESLYRRFSPRLKGHCCCCRRESPIQPLGERPSPSGDTDASTWPQPVKISHWQYRHLNQESSTARSCPAMTTEACMDSSHNCCLPPKKRYTYGCL